MNTLCWSDGAGLRGSGIWRCRPQRQPVVFPGSTEVMAPLGRLCHTALPRILAQGFGSLVSGWVSPEPVSSFAATLIRSISQRRPVPLGHLLDSWTGYQPDYTTCLHVIQTASASRPCPRPVCLAPSCFPHVV